MATPNLRWQSPSTVPPASRGFLSVSTRGLQAGRIEATDSRLEMDRTDLVSCGSSSPGHHFVIVDPETCAERGEREIGEIWATGPSVSAGYWQAPRGHGGGFWKIPGHRSRPLCPNR